MRTSFFYTILLLSSLLTSTSITAQATLSFQGILKKANGVAVEDGTYPITFSLYNDSTGGINLWSETQPKVEVSSGIYSVLLGSKKPLNVAFDQIYYLGIKVGSYEMTPRLRLTSAPYALSLVGQSNLFPSSGMVKADELNVVGKLSVGDSTLSPTHTIFVSGGVLASPGAPGTDGANNKGYAFDGDEDSGLFSTEEGTVSLFADNMKRLQINEEGISVNGDVILGTNNSIIYNGQKDWRLVLVEVFDENAPNGWQAYDQAKSSSNAPSGIETFKPNSPFINSWTIRPKDISHFLKKKITLPAGTEHQEIKIVFTCYFLGAWDTDQNNAAVAGFQKNITDDLTVAWYGKGHRSYESYYQQLDPVFDHGRGNYQQANMVAHYTDDEFYICFGGLGLDGNERYAIGGIEIWVR